MSDNWKSDLLGNVATLQRGFDLPHRLRRSGKVPIVTSSGVEDTHNEAKVKAPGVITGRYGTIGEVFYIDEDFWPHNTTLYVRDFHGNDPLFISYLLRTIDFHMHSGKTGVPGVNRNDLHEITVSIPLSVTEQEAIAEALSDADALIEALEQLIAKKRQVKQGAMQELLTGKRRLSGFSRNWEEKTIGSFADVKTGPFGSALHERDYVSQGTPLITVEHLSESGLVHSNMSMVSDFDVQRLKAYTVQVNDVLFSRVGVVDRNSLIKKDETGWLFSGSLLRLRIIKEDVHAPFISYFFYSEPFRNYVLSMAVGQTRLSLNTIIISNTPIVIPSIPEQIAIAEILSDMDAEIAALEEKLSKARQVKQGMMQELLTGRVRLV